MNAVGRSTPTVAVIVYTAGSECRQCQLTQRVMREVGVSYREVDLTDDANAAAREYVTDDLGYFEAPVVVVDDNEHWSGFQPRRIKDLAARLGVRTSTAGGLALSGGYV